MLDLLAHHRHLMSFATRLRTLRHDRGLSQPALADQIGLHVSQLRRYEYGKAQPTLDVLKRLALALNTSADTLIFDEEERTIPDDLTHLLEALNDLDPDERNAIRALIEGALLRHQARKLAATA